MLVNEVKALKKQISQLEVRMYCYSCVCIRFGSTHLWLKIKLPNSLLCTRNWLNDLLDALYRESFLLYVDFM